MTENTTSTNVMRLQVVPYQSTSHNIRIAPKPSTGTQNTSIVIPKISTVTKKTSTATKKTSTGTQNASTVTKKNNEASEKNGVSDSNPSAKSDQNINLQRIFKTKENSNIESCFKGESLQQLSTNSLPPYVPDSPPNIVKQDASYEYQCCTDCGDTFAVKSSLAFHLDRRSVLIKFPCDTCKTVQIFYNRCKLLSHIRTHTDKSETSDVAKAVVNPLPRIFMDGLQTEFVNTLDEELSTIRDAEDTPATDLLEFSLKEVDSNSSPEKPNSEENKNVVKVKCLDCNEEFNNPEERAKHLTQNDKIPVIMNQCNKCNMICPSKCFLKAHQRVHLQVSPYVCPECGDSPSPLWPNFQYHVKFKCFHNARSVGYKCPVCKRLSPSNYSLLKHMELHSEKYLKCDSCASAYMNVATFNSHIDLYHPGFTIKPKYNMIFKCALCDIVFVNNEQMVSHRSTHLKDQICEYVFNCMQCGKPLETKSQLSDHIKNSHPKIYKTILESLQSKTKPPEAVVITYRGKVECLLCSLTFHSHQGYIAHLSKAHFNHNQPCTYCYMVLNNRKEMMNHGKKHLNKGSFLCLLCNNKRWTDEKQLDAHLCKHVAALEYCTFCPICDEILKTPPEAIRHLREEHMLFEEMGILTQLKTPQYPKEIVTCHFCRNSFANETELQEHLETVHNVESLKRSNSVEIDNACESSQKKNRVNGNICAKCNYHSVEREDFKKHIISHKINKFSLQCQECGLCFVVEPALIKHLRIVHKIGNPKKYIDDEGTNCTPDFENQAALSSCNSLLCSVCFTTFPNETSLKTHMRSHGMAFIQSAKSTTNQS